MANVLSERDKVVVDFDPIFSGQFRAQCHLRLLWCFCFDIAPAVCDAMDVRVDADSQFAVALRQDQVRCFAPHARQRYEFVDLIRHAPIVFL